MRSLAHIFILLLVSYNVFSASTDIEEAFKSFMIVPSTLPEAPKSLLTMRFADKVTMLGNVFTPSEVAWPPSFTFEAKQNELFTLLIIDVSTQGLLIEDSTTNLLMMIVNIPGNDAVAGDVVSPYIPPSPIPGSGYHYYVHLIYKQSSRFDINAQYFLDLPGNYEMFSLEDFTEAYDLSDPVAGNFYISRSSICLIEPPKKLSKCR